MTLTDEVVKIDEIVEKYDQKEEPRPEHIQSNISLNSESLIQPHTQAVLATLVIGGPPPNISRRVLYRS